MNKLENLLEAAKLNELVGRKIEEEKKNNKLVWILAIIGAVVVIAGIAYAVFRYLTPDEEEVFEDEFEDETDEPAEEENVAEEPVEEQPQVDPNAPVKVKVNYSSVNIRKTPSASGEFVAAAQKGDVFTKIGEEGEWTKIEFDGSDAYIKSDLLKIVTE